MGFIDLKHLETRTAVCVDCHVGPRNIQEVTYEVNHDLIAAGHPRLSFEMDAYLTNLPAHWDRRRDESQYGSRTGGSFHVNLWRFGQQRIAAQQLVRWRSANADVHGSRTPVDLAAFRCLDCHQPLTARSRAGAPTRRLGEPRLDWTSLESLARAQSNNAEVERSIRRLLDAESPIWSDVARGGLPSAWSQVVEHPSLWIPLAPLARTDLASHAGQLRDMLRQGRGAAEEAAGDTPSGDWMRSWDDAVHLLLAADSLHADMPAGDPRDTLGDAREQLRRALEDPIHFASGPSAGGEVRPTLYDAPAHFDRSRLTEPLERLGQALDSIASDRGEARAR